jgi:formylglycine-generating enzyme required for sulfatase activity
MIVVPAGSFLMGSPEGKGKGLEHPQHGVTIAEPFAVSKYELTFDKWDACVAHGDCDPHVSDNGWGRGRQPVINVSRDDAEVYVAWLSRITGEEYRLLSEAQYEYAARAGTQTPYFWGVDIGTGNANCKSCGNEWDGKQPAPVGSFAPNRFGLYDMVGNVWEWVEDCIHSSYKDAPVDGSSWSAACPDDRFGVIRGGSWDFAPVDLRSASRITNPTGGRNYNMGFRVGRILPAGAGTITVAPGAH